MKRDAQSAGRAKPGIESENGFRKGGSLGANSEIGRKLKQYYDELVSDQVPDRFAQLLSQLEGTEKQRGEA